MPKDQPNFPLPGQDFYLFAISAEQFRELEWYAHDTGVEVNDVAQEAIEQFIVVNVDALRGAYEPEESEADDAEV